MSMNRVRVSIVFYLIIAAILLSSCSNPSDPFPTGMFSWGKSKHYEFFDDGAWTWGSKFDEPMLTGQYAVDGTTITFHSESMIDGSAGGCGDNEGSYTWVYEDEVLSFEKLDDTCGPRIVDNGVDYTLVKE